MTPDQEAKLMQVFGKAIAFHRNQRGLTQEYVAERLDIGYEAVSRIERGVVAPNVLRIWELAEIFECRVDDLLSNTSGRTLDQANHIAQLIERLSEADRRMIVEMVEMVAGRLQKKR